MFKRGDLYKFWILMHQSSGFLISIKTKLSQVDCCYLPINTFVAENFFNCKKNIFWTQFEFLIAQNLCKSLALVTRVLFSKFRFSHFSSVPTMILEKNNRTKKLKKWQILTKKAWFKYVIFTYILTKNHKNFGPKYHTPKEKNL